MHYSDVSTARQEEGLHQMGTFVGEHSTYYLCTGMKGGASCICGITSLRVASAINHSPYLGPGERPGTHQAWLYGDIESALLQVFSAERLRGGCDGLHLGVGGDIGQSLGEVVASAYYEVVAHYNGADGYLVGVEGTLGFT